MNLNSGFSVFYKSQLLQYAIAYLL